MGVDNAEFTRLLQAAQQGDASAASAVFPLVYASMRDLARRQMSRESPGHTLQATALVHEAYLKLMGGGPVEWTGRAHFYRAAAEAMRRILIDHARSKATDKRGGGYKLVSTNLVELAAHADSEEILALEEAISRLEGRDKTAGEIVRLRFYAGLSVDETAAALQMSRRTVMREWAFARATLFRELSEGTS